MEEQRNSTGQLLNAWRDATRAAELADSLSASASEASTTADDVAVAAEEIAILAEQAAKAAERAATRARDAAIRAKELARKSRVKRGTDADDAIAAHAAEDAARDAYHAGVAEAEERQKPDAS